MAEEGSMESVIDRLVGEHGYEAVYSYIMERMKRDFEFMGGVIGAVKEEVKVVAPVKEKKPVVKKKVQVVAEGGAEAVAEVVPAENTIGNVVAPATVVVAAAPAEQKKKEETGVELPLEGDAPEQNLSVKQRQKLDQDETRARLEKEGKTVEMMLTVENMHQWIVVEKRSYAYIASKLVGCPQKLVSDFAKANGLKSTYEGKVGVAVGMKK